MWEELNWVFLKLLGNFASPGKLWKTQMLRPPPRPIWSKSLGATQASVFSAKFPGRCHCRVKFNNPMALIYIYTHLVHSCPSADFPSVLAVTIMSYHVSECLLSCHSITWGVSRLLTWVEFDIRASLPSTSHVYPFQSPFSFLILN